MIFSFEKGNAEVPINVEFPELNTFTFAKFGFPTLITFNF